MTDNVSITPGVGAAIAADDVGGVLYQRVKVSHGADGSATDASGSNPLPVTIAGGTFAYASGTSTGTVDVPAGARLKRVSVVAGASAAATVTIAGGSTITIPAGFSFDEQIAGDVTAGGDVVIGGTVQSFYVSWTA